MNSLVSTFRLSVCLISDQVLEVQVPFFPLQSAVSVLEAAEQSAPASLFFSAEPISYTQLQTLKQ